MTEEKNVKCERNVQNRPHYLITSLDLFSITQGHNNVQLRTIKVDPENDKKKIYKLNKIEKYKNRKINGKKK